MAVNWGKLDLSVLVFLLPPPGGNPFKPSYPRNTEASTLAKEGSVQNGPQQHGEKSLNLVKAISPYKLTFLHFGLKV